MASLFIMFDSACDTYRAGNPVAGKLILTNVDHLPMENVEIKFKGRAKTFWTEGFTEISDKKVYIYESMVVKPRPIRSCCSQNIVYHVPFNFQIPDICPPSFESDCGNIRYKISVKIRLHLMFNLKSKRRFKVIVPCDFNSDSKNLLPYNVAKTKSFRSLCCSSGKFAVDVCLKHQGVVVGGAIYLYFEIMNRSRRTINEIRIELLEKTVYRAGSKKREADRRIAEFIKEMEIRPHEYSVFCIDNVKVPLDAKVVVNCSIIEKSHTLKIWIYTSGCTCALQFVIPVKICVAPLTENISMPTQCLHHSRNAEYHPISSVMKHEIGPTRVLHNESNPCANVRHDSQPQSGGLIPGWKIFTQSSEP